MPRTEMTLGQAERILTNEPLRFGDERQIEALRLLGTARDLEEREIPNHLERMEMKSWTRERLKSVERGIDDYFR